MAGPFFETPLTSISYPASDSDSDSESVDFADGWTCCKCAYTLQLRSTPLVASAITGAVQTARTKKLSN